MKTLLFTFLITQLAFADLTLLGRYGLNQGYEFPNDSLAPNSTPLINNNGDVVLRTWGMEGENRSGIWTKNVKKGNARLLHYLDNNLIIHDLALGNNSVLFTTGILGEVQEVYQQGLKDKSPKLIMGYDEVIEFGQVSYPGFIQGESVLGLKVTNNRGAQRLIFNDGNTWKTFLRKNKNVLYIFSPEYTQNGHVIVKVWEATSEGSHIEAIHVYKYKNNNMVLEHRLPFTSSIKLRNSLAASSNLNIGFIFDQEDKTFINLWNPIQTRTQTHEITNHKPQYFAPTISNGGTLVFKGYDSLVKINSETKKQTVIFKIYDSIQTDLGESLFFSKFGANYTFTYGIDMNDSGKLTFKGSLHSKDKMFSQGVGVFSYDLSK